MVASLYSRRVCDGPKGTDLNELTSNGRKGFAYDWQNLLDAETLIALDRDLDLKLELATAYAE